MRRLIGSLKRGRAIERSIVAFLVTGCLVRAGYACEMSAPQYTVGSHLTVTVSYSGTPLNGVEVKLSRMDLSSAVEPLKTVASTKSDKDGKARISGLVPGQYLITEEYAGVGGDAAELNAVPEGSSSAIQSGLTLKWPDQAVFKARTLVGTLMRTRLLEVIAQNGSRARGRTETPLSNVNLRLTESTSGSVLRDWLSDEQGSFDAGVPSPGLYVLHVSEANSKSPTRVDGDILIEITPDAPNERMPTLALSVSSCGTSASPLTEPVMEDKSSHAKTN